MAGDVDHVVGTAQDEEIAILIAHRPVGGGVEQILEAGEVTLHEALVVAPHRAQAARRQRRLHDQHPFFATRDFRTGPFVDDPDVVAVHREPRRTEAVGLEIHARQVGQHRPAGLGLPVMVDDRNLQRVGDPARGRFVQRLAGQEQITQAGDVVLRHVLLILRLQDSHRRRRREHGPHLIFVDDLPPDARVRPNRQPFVEDGRRTVDQRSVDDIGMPHHPADVGGGEHGLAGVDVVEVLHGRSQRHRITADIALHALGNAGGAGSVENVARLVRFQPDHRYFGVHVLGAQRRVIQIATFDQRQALVQTPVAEHDFFRREFGQAAGFIDQMLVGHGLAAAHAGVGGDHDLGLGIVDTYRQVVGGKSTEHHRVNGPDPGAGQDGEQGFGDHRHVDDDPIALADAQRLQHGGETVHFAI